MAKVVSLGCALLLTVNQEFSLSTGKLLKIKLYM